MKKPELLAPAGDLEKLKFAINYGADAVYIGGQIFGLRASAKNFSFEQMQEGIEYAHNRSKKVYLTLNIIPHNEDLELLKEYLESIKELGVDAVILSDPGTLMYVKEMLPQMEIHLSTQANNTNYMSAKFWHSQGVKRVILARELSINEIEEIASKTPETLELESFVHGAMCISYSGRCLLSNYLNDRDSNKGDCSQPCRWKYSLVEETRPGEYIPVVEEDGGTFFFNSKDLCVIENIDQVIESGINSLKIEGRMKTVYYVANIVRAYRKAIDDYLADPKNYEFNPELLTEIKKASYRKFTKGFYFEKPSEDAQLYESSSYVRNYDFVGIVLDYDEDTKIATIEQRNRFFKGDKLEIMGPDYYNDEIVITEIIDEYNKSVDVAPRAKQIVKIPFEKPVKPYFILRKAREEV